MKKSMDNKNINVKLNKEQLKWPSELHSNYSSGNEYVNKKSSEIQKKFKDIQPRMCENIEFEILKFAHENYDNKSELGSLNLSEASSSVNFDPENCDLNKSDMQKPKIFLQQNFNQLQYMAGKKPDKVKDFRSSSYKVKKASDFNIQYPVEVIKLSHGSKSIEEVKSTLNINFSESFFDDKNFRDSRKEDYFKHEEKLYRFDKAKEETDDLKKKAPALKRILKKKTILSKPKQKKHYKFSGVKPHPKEIPSELVFSKERSKKTEKETKNSNVKEKQIAVRSTFLVTPEEDLETKRKLLDFYIYIIYLTVITAIALTMMSSNMFYFTNITTSMFFDTSETLSFNNFSNETENLYSKVKPLRESRTVEDFWAFAETTLLDMLYWRFYYSRIDPDFHEELDDRKMMYGNQILGVARLRQVRVRSDSCKIHPDVQRYFSACYFYYSVFAEETEPIKDGMENSSTSTAWVYTEAKELGSSYYWGKMSVYGGGGYYLDLSESKDSSAKMIQELKENFWISQATRAVFINFNIYNANANLFCLCRIVLEFPPVGGIIPVADFHSLKLIRYLSVLDFFILALEILFLLFVIYYTWQTIQNLIHEKLSFFLYFWNYINLLLLILSYIYIILSFVRYFFVMKLMSSLTDRYDKYTEFDFVKSIQIQYNNNIAVLLFLCWMKLFKYFNFNTVLLEFKITLARSIKDILGFFPMFLTMFLAFAFLAYLLFGNQVKSYNTLWLSFLTLLQAFLGEFYYTDIVESNRILGSLFYIAYIFFIFFVLLNVFIAIINDAYKSVKSQVNEKPITGEYMKRGLANIFTCGHVNFNKKLHIRETKKKILFEEIETALKKAGFSTTEINLFFYKYNINFSNFLEENTKKRVLEDLELKRVDLSETSEQVQINALRRRLDELTTKMEDFDSQLQPLLDKIDVLLRSSKI